MGFLVSSPHFFLSKKILISFFFFILTLNLVFCVRSVAVNNTVEADPFQNITIKNLHTLLINVFVSFHQN